MQPDPIPSTDIEAETKSFLSTEFFFYILPCYYAMASFAYRYIVVMRQEPKKRVQQLPAEFVVSCFQQAEDSGQEVEVPPASYTIKSKLSLINSYLYLLMMALGILGDPDMFYAASHRTYSLLYVWGFVAWSMSALILKREYERDVTQSLWTHRFFWIFAGVFSVTKMFEDYLLPLNFILNSLFIGINSILILYALYRSEDRFDNLIQFGEDVPMFARIFFQKLELNPYVRKYLKISDATVVADEDTPAAIQGLTPEQLQAFEKALQQKQADPREEVKLLNQLPRRNIIINRRPVIKRINNTIKYYFLIISQIGADGSFRRFETERKYIEFVELEASLTVHFSEKNFPKLRLPRLNKTEFLSIPDSAESDRRSEILQTWLQEVLATPIFIIGSVLKFLNVDEQASAPFLTYYNTSFRSFCSKTFLSTAFRQNRNIQTKQQRVSMWNPIDDHSNTHDDAAELRARLKAAKLEFQVTADPDSLKKNTCTFEIVCRPPRCTPIRWTITKSEDQLLLLNEKIEEQLGHPVPFFYTELSRIPESQRRDAKCSVIKLTVYQTYLRSLLDSSPYYSFALFQFLGFDPLRLEVIADRVGGPVVFSNRFSVSYNNTYISELFVQTIKPIEILEVSMEQVDPTGDSQQNVHYLFRFRIKKGEADYKKQHEQLVKLRTKLLHIYRGIASLPELPNFSLKATKSQLPRYKQDVEGFLQAVESLPQIAQNLSYCNFYHVGHVAATQENSPIKMIQLSPPKGSH